MKKSAPPGEKDPRRQLQGAASKAQGRLFEDRLDASFARYRESGEGDKPPQQERYCDGPAPSAAGSKTPKNV